MGIIPRISAGSKVIWLELSTVNASSAHIESESSAHIANESSAHRETASSAHKERSSAHIDAGNQPFRVWLGGWGGDKSVIDAGNKGGIHGLKSSLDSAIWGLVGGGGGVIKASLMLGTRVGSMDLNHHLTQPFRVWLGGVGGDKSVIDAGNKGGIHGLKSSLDSAIWGLVGGGCVRNERSCEMSCVTCEMSGNTWDELCELWDEWSCVRWVVWVVRWVVWKNLGELQWEHTKAAPPNATRKQLLSELSCVRWVVRDELCEMSCVTCEMRGVVWDELCELWDERSCVTWVVWVVRWVVWKNLGEVQCEDTKAAPPNATRKQLLSELSCVRWVEWDELCELSCERWLVWDELCELWDERSCVRWNVRVVWDNLGEVERERSNSGGEGEGKEYKPKNKSPAQRCEEKNHTLMSCVMMFKKKS